MTYAKNTTIIGYDAPEPAGFSQLSTMDQYVWRAEHARHVSLRGHWQVDAARRVAARLNFHNATMYHSILDLSGKGRGGTEAKFHLAREDHA